MMIRTKRTPPLIITYSTAFRGRGKIPQQTIILYVPTHTHTKILFFENLN